MSTPTSVAMEVLIDKLVSQLIGRKLKWDDYIMLPTKDRMVHDLTEDYIGHEKLQSKKSEQIQIDSGSIGDMFKWYFGRDIELDQADTEDTIAYLEDKLSRHKKKFIYNHYDSKGYTKVDLGNGRWKKKRILKYHESDAAKAAFNVGMDLKKQIDEIAGKLDRDLVPAGPQDANTPTEGQAMCSYLEMYIDTMSLGELAVALDVIDQMHANQELSWFYYSKCALAVSYRLNKAAPTWQNKYGEDKGGCWNKSADKAWDDYQMYCDGKTFSPTHEDRFYGEMSIDMEDAIDKKREAERLAKHHNMSVEDMWYLLCEQDEDYGVGMAVERTADDFDMSQEECYVEYTWE